VDFVLDFDLHRRIIIVGIVQKLLSGKYKNLIWKNNGHCNLLDVLIALFIPSTSTSFGQ